MDVVCFYWLFSDTRLQFSLTLANHFNFTIHHHIFVCLQFRHAHTLAAVQAYSHWLAQFYGETQRQPTNQEKFVPLLRSIIEAIEPLLGKEVPAKVVQAAVHLFLSISTTVRPTFLVELPQVQKMFNDVSRGSMSSHPTDVSLRNRILKEEPSLVKMYGKGLVMNRG